MERRKIMLGKKKKKWSDHISHLEKLLIGPKLIRTFLNKDQTLEGRNAFSNQKRGQGKGYPFSKNSQTRILVFYP